MSEKGPAVSQASTAAGALGAILLVVGVLMIATGVIARTYSTGGGTDDLRVTAGALRVRLGDGLAGAARALEPKAVAAARLPEIASGLDLDADVHTFEDLLENEDWWAPYRSEFPLSGVVTASGALAMIMGTLEGSPNPPAKGLAGQSPAATHAPMPGTQEASPKPLAPQAVGQAPAATRAVLGSGVPDLGGSPVVRRAREAGVGSGVTGMQGTAFLLAAARVPPGKNHVPGAVVILGAPLERPALQAVADGAGTAVVLSDGKRVLAAAGPEAARTALAALVGREAGAGEAGLIKVEGGQAGVTVAIDRGLWLDAVLPALPIAPGSHIGLVIGAAGALLGGAGLVISVVGRRRRGIASDGPAAVLPAAAGGVPARPSSRHDIDLLSAPQPVPELGSDRHALSGAATAAAMLEPPAGPGVTLGRYRLLERIGEGGMAEIFVAAAHGPEGFVRHFVVKRMHPHMARSRDAVNQFIDEGRLLSGLVHSNIVPVFDFGRVGEEYFLALEYIHGRDLEKIVRRHVEMFGRSLDLPVAFYIMHEVLEALAYAHGRTDAEGRNLSIVHRDVAPGNILVSAGGEVKLSDFGIAKAEGRMTRTEVGLIKGNVSFMSPEQARGDPVDARSDLFSAAVVLYYCLTAQFLYKDETVFNRLVKAAIGPASTEFIQLGELPPAAAQVLTKALALDPGQRYQSARDFARDLEGHFTAGRSGLAVLMDTLFPELPREAR